MALDPSDLAILQRRVRALVDPEIIAEHRADPFGHHSPALLEILHFLRRNPDPALARYLLVRAGDPPEWRVGRRGPRPGAPVEPVGGERFPSRAAAEHAVFLRRLDDLGLSA